MNALCSAMCDSETGARGGAGTESQYFTLGVSGHAWVHSVTSEGHRCALMSSGVLIQ